MLQNLINRLIEAKTVENVLVRVGRGEEILYDAKASANGRYRSSRAHRALPVY